MTDYLNKKNSILVKPFEIKKICDALTIVCQNRKDLLKKKSNGIRLIKNKYTNDIMGEKYLNYLNKTIYD